MSRFSIRHETRYDYEHPVRFGPHRLLVRPRDSHAIRLIAADLTLSPPGETRWSLDAMGNCVCQFTPQGEARTLSIVSDLVLARYPAPLDLFPVSDPRSATPVDYAFEDRVLLAPFMAPATPDAQGVTIWTRSHLGPVGEPAMDFLLRLNHVIHDSFEYLAREAEGVQTPAATLRLSSGSCRDYAWLMVEALRHVGYGARFVTGYLYSPGQAPTCKAVRGAGATHAWAQVFLPDLGWLEFDPTNGVAESPDLIPIAVARIPEEAAPISGVLHGRPGASKLTVAVDVRRDDTAPAAA
jgi:transglutaminase-like putative cysteine protease